MRHFDIPIPVVCILFAVLLAAPPSLGEEEPVKVAAPEPAEVKEAVRLGVLALKAEQAGDGSFDREVGSTGLAILALAHSGVPPEDRTVGRALRWLLANLGRTDTYGASLAIMALSTLDRDRHAKRILRLAGLLEQAQCDNGQWSYALRPGRSSGDNSNTQFAILALWYARGAGHKADRGVWSRCREFFTGSQNEDGGWGYSAKERKKSYGSMTATGLTALAVCRAGEKALALSDPAIRVSPGADLAVDWLREHFGVDRNPEANFKLGGGMRGVRKEVGDSYWRFYWLWSLERAATISGLEKIGDHDWYAEGAAALLAEQRKDGSWVGSEASLFATCFALLFLDHSTRGAVATEPPVVGGTTTPVPR